MERVPHTSIYTMFLTVIIALAVLWFLYIITPESNYNIYYVKDEQPQINKELDKLDNEYNNAYY